MTKRYDEYKDSGVEWLGEIPSHWRIKKLKNHLKMISKGATPTSVSPFKEKNTDILFLKSTNIQNNKLDFKECFYISKEEHLKMNKSKIKKNDLMFSIAGYIGKVCIVDVETEMNTNQALAFLRTKNIEEKFLYYYFSSENVISKIKNNSVESIIQNLSMNVLSNTEILFPIKKEQQAIANYLDNKTSKIDSAVAELEKQKSLLIELKKSTIHQAVTKGLDLTVPMKDSGIEWVGDVPNHWVVNSLKNFVNYKTGNTPDSNNQSYYSENGFEWANISDLGNKKLPKTKKMLSKDGVDSKNLEQVKSNSLLYSFKLSVGLCSITDRAVYTNEAIAAFEENHKVDVRFLYYSLGSHFYNNAKENIYGAPLLNRTLIENGKYTAPNKKEQEKIANYLDEKTGQIDQSIEVIYNQIAKMKEYKKTLINDVVTGKIKVV